MKTHFNKICRKISRKLFQSYKFQKVWKGSCAEKQQCSSIFKCNSRKKSHWTLLGSQNALKRHHNTKNLLFSQHGEKKYTWNLQICETKDHVVQRQGGEKQASVVMTESLKEQLQMQQELLFAVRWPELLLKCNVCSFWIAIFHHFMLSNHQQWAQKPLAHVNTRR